MAVKHASAIVQEALRQVGMMEERPYQNDGAYLRQYLKETGFQPGQAWCLYLALAIVGHAWPDGEKLPPQLANLQNGSATGLRTVAQKYNAWKPRTVSTGAIMLLHDGKGASPVPGLGDEYHAGICLGESEPRPGWLVCLEGNTNAKGGPEGIEVAVKLRPIAMTSLIVW